MLVLHPPLTDDVVVVHALELVAPEVGRELLELDGEAALPRGLVAREHDVGGAHHLAAVRLLPRRHEVQLVELVVRRGPGGVQRGADEVQPVPDLRVQNVALIVPEPGGRKSKGRESVTKVVCAQQQQYTPVCSRLSLLLNGQQTGPLPLLILPLRYYFLAFMGNRCLYRGTAVQSTAQINFYRTGSRNPLLTPTKWPRENKEGNLTTS